MARKFKELNLIFTRDFGLFTAEFWRDYLMAREVKKICGQGISEQVTWYDGRVEKYFRIANEVNKLKKQTINLPLDHYLLSNEASLKFKNDVSELRKLMQNFKPASAEDLVFAFREALLIMSRLYPWYMMSIFIPGPWADDFIKIHGQGAKKYLEQLYINRILSEGLLKEFSIFIRKILAFKLKSLGHKIIYANVLRYKEGTALLEKDIVPPILKLKQRLNGYVSSKNVFITNQIFIKAINKLGYKYVFPELDIERIQGSVAYRTNKLIKGRVKIILTPHDVATFPRRAILVTPMTAPDFLPAMRKAAAIITDEGGITCHAAIVARELKKPCIIGTKIATQVLKNGNMVLIDSTSGTIELIKHR